MSQVAAITEVVSHEEEESGRQDTYTLASHVVLAVIDDGTSRLLDLDGDFYGLPALSTSMLREALRSGSTAAAGRIAGEYQVPVDRVQEDLRQFLGNLERAGLIELAGRRNGWARRIRSLAAGAFLGIARLVGTGAAAALTEKIRVWILLTATRLSFWLFGWAETVATLEKLVPKAERPPCQEAWARAVDRIDGLVRDVAARHPLVIECKERAVCCWLLLREQVWPAELVIGVDLFPFVGHCWCESGTRMLSDDPHRCQRFVPVFRYE